MTNRTVSIPEIHCGHCKSSIDGADTTFAAVVEAIEDVGYDVPAQ